MQQNYNRLSPSYALHYSAIRELFARTGDSELHEHVFDTSATVISVLRLYPCFSTPAIPNDNRDYVEGYPST
ncbi:hypothetical protein DL768_011610 [Monosporascus sp. mg162]|nr:hypothetical protein DL768_011610 [Monosporascus sp. mg162]